LRQAFLVLESALAGNSEEPGYLSSLGAQGEKLIWYPPVPAWPKAKGTMRATPTAMTPAVPRASKAASRTEGAVSLSLHPGRCPASPNSNFVGELLIIRRCRLEQEQTLGFVASTVAAHVEWESHSRHHPDSVLAVRPLALVLEGRAGSVLRFAKMRHVNNKNEAWALLRLPNSLG
jgi:hypothetical protein